MNMRYLVVIEQGPTSCGAFVPDLPGCIAAGETEAETLGLIQEAIRFQMKELRRSGKPIPEPVSKSIIVEIGLIA